MEFRDRPQFVSMLPYLHSFQHSPSPIPRLLDQHTGFIPVHSVLLFPCMDRSAILHVSSSLLPCAPPVSSSDSSLSPQCMNCCNPSMGLCIPPLSSAVVVLDPSLSCCLFILLQAEELLYSYIHVAMSLYNMFL